MKHANPPVLSTLVAAILSTKGGVAKTTDTANLGGWLADQGLKVLMIDADIRQPTLSSYYPLDYEAPGGIYELIAHNELDPVMIISHTAIPGLDIIISNDPRGELMSLLQAAPDGVIRLRHLVRQIPGYDIILIDTIGARTIALEMVLLASDLVVSPVLPEMLSAREFLRGTLQMYQDLQPFTRYGIPLPPLKAVINKLDHTNDAREIHHNLLQVLQHKQQEQELLVPTDILTTPVYASVAYRRAASLGMPVHRLDAARPKGRTTPCAAETMRSLAEELFPQLIALPSRNMEGIA
ncbi:ParA family protein [Salmonella enterica]|nr:ParA family protein [Salmonella enterica]ECC8902117.1 ParA family protein [Salmonella enterica subsp. diarizonae]EDT4351426.1 ParA family protein [Salmonella enterica subsp. diarizonae serovar 50:k:z]EIQ3223190.1 ParA family protein [Salmonella enterica subsp. diarizonae serovar 50:k:z53]EAN5690611.1 ParA family protein [Salmonella enterica]